MFCPGKIKKKLPAFTGKDLRVGLSIYFSCEPELGYDIIKKWKKTDYMTVIPNDLKISTGIVLRICPTG